jgi:GNAT superfamily N-acetyltransferase
METINIEEAGLKEIPTLQSIAEIAFRATYKEILTPGQMEYMMDWMYSTASLQQQFADGHRYFIASLDRRPVGYVSIEPQGPQLVHLQKIYVLPSEQGKGIGARLFRHATDYIRAHYPSPCIMELNVNRHNRAVTFYEHMGMHKDREGDFPIGEGYYMNDYIMQITL